MTAITWEFTATAVLITVTGVTASMALTRDPGLHANAEKPPWSLPRALGTPAEHVPASRAAVKGSLRRLTVRRQPAAARYARTEMTS
jgi:hypothetical protein